MPAAHALLQAAEDVERVAAGLNADELWARPGGGASVGFHLVHIAGSLDRLFTYARGEGLSEAQRAAAAAEAQAAAAGFDAAALVAGVRAAVERALAQLRATPAASLLEPRPVGRGRLPSTVLGLLFHGAEHAQRHVGQIIATVKAARAGGADPAGGPP
jgi:uncharacterized damage-inducible protein DinB